jgi:aspartate racemase
VLTIGRLGGMSWESSAEYYRLAKRAGAGAQGIVLRCTEIEPVITERDSPVPVFPTTHLHVKAAVEIALGAA